MKLTAEILAKEIIDDDFETKEFFIRPRDKNDEFCIRYSLGKEEVGNILHSVNAKCFRGKIKNEDKNIKADWLYEFSLLYQLTNEFGTTDMIPIYFKICEVNNRILIVSIHD